MLRTLIGLRQKGVEAGLAAARAAAAGSAGWAAGLPGGGLAAAGSECSSSGGSGGTLCQPWEGRRMAHSSSRRCSSGAQWEVLRQQVRRGRVLWGCCTLSLDRLCGAAVDPQEAIMTACWTACCTPTGLPLCGGNTCPSQLCLLPGGPSSQPAQLPAWVPHTQPSPVSPLPTTHPLPQGFQVNPCNSRLHPSVTEVGAALRCAALRLAQCWQSGWGMAVPCSQTAWSLVPPVGCPCSCYARCVLLLRCCCCPPIALWHGTWQRGAVGAFADRLTPGTAAHPSGLRCAGWHRAGQ